MSERSFDTSPLDENLPPSQAGTTALSLRSYTPTVLPGFVSYSMASAAITNLPGRSKRVMHERVFFERRFGEGKSLISVGPLANLYARAPPSGVWTIGGGVQGLRSYSNVVGRDLENHVSVLRSQELLFLMVKSVVICLECSRCKQHLKFEALSR